MFDIDPVQVGILVKRARTFCWLRPRRGCVALSFKLSRPLADRRVRKSLQTSANRMAHFVDLVSPDEVDDQIRDWLAEVYLDLPI